MPAPAIAPGATFATRASRLLVVVAAFVSLLQLVVCVTQSNDFIVKHLVLDDAIYFCKPARNFVEGRGFSFDGIHRTNGVQPLWAILVTLFATVVRDDMILIRTIAALSGICWIAAGVQLWRWLAPTSRFAAAIASIGWLMAGVEMRLAHTGMENGLQGLLVVTALLAARKLAATPRTAAERGRRSLLLGALTAAMCLNRVEYGLLAAFWTAWLFFSGGGALRTRLRELAPFLLPVVIAVGAWAVFSRVYFGDWTPVSGAVKAHVTSHLLPSGSLLASFWYHTLVSARLAMLPVLFGWSAVVQSIDFFMLATIFLVAAAVTIAVGTVAWSRGLRRGTSTLDWPAVTFFAFALVHVLLVSKFLAAYTEYCSWWFTGEILAVWAAFGLVLGKTRWLPVRLAMWPLCVCILVAAVERPTVYLAKQQWRIPGTEAYVELGRWIESWLPAGSRIAAFNSGFLAFEARSHTVVNIDGLMNDGDFLRRYLVHGRIDEYLADENLRYVADNMPLRLWQDSMNGIGSRLPPNLRPIYCKRSVTGSLGCLFDAFPDTPGPRVPAHPLAAVLWRQLSQHPDRLVDHTDRGRIPPDHEIVASLVDDVTGVVKHVVVGREEAANAVDTAGLARLPAIGASFGGLVELLACESPVGSILRGSSVAFTSYWRAGDSPLRDDLRLCLVVGEPEVPAAPALARVDEPAHGTLPPRSWAKGRVVAHTTWVTVPADLAPRSYPVWITVRSGDANVPPVGRPGTAIRAGTLRVTAD